MNGTLSPFQSVVNLISFRVQRLNALIAKLHDEVERVQRQVALLGRRADVLIQRALERYGQALELLNCPSEPPGALAAARLQEEAAALMREARQLNARADHLIQRSVKRSQEIHAMWARL